MGGKWAEKVLFAPRAGVLVTKRVILPNGMTGLERKLINSFVGNGGRMLKEISVDQRKFVSYGIGVSKGTVERFPNRETQRWEEVGKWLGRDEDKRWGPWLISFNSEEGGGLGGSPDQGVAGITAEFVELSSHSVLCGMLAFWPLQSLFPPRCWAQLLRAAPAGWVKRSGIKRSEEKAGDTGLCKMHLFFLVFDRWTRCNLAESQARQQILPTVFANPLRSLLVDGISSSHFFPCAGHFSLVFIF